LVIFLLAPTIASLPDKVYALAPAVVFLLVATLPHLLAQIALARQLAATAPISATPAG
jgi:hypothetical protein